MSFQTGTLKEDCSIAESLMIAGAFVLYGREFAGLAQYLGKTDDHKEGLRHIREMIESIIAHGWDGEWFLRAYDSKGNKVGSKENMEGKIFIEPQSFCCMSGIGINEGKVDMALNAVKKHLSCNQGIALVYPAYSEYRIELGEISTFLEGYKENGSVFCHNNPWIMIAETLIERGNQAFDYYTRLNPSYLEDSSEIHKTEPYVYAQMIAGKQAYKPGEAKNSWLTGASAWNFVAISQYILGIRADFDGLFIDPCIPSFWQGFNVTRKFRGATYHIKVTNPNTAQKGVKSIVLNGKLIIGNKLPIMQPESKNIVDVLM